MLSFEKAYDIDNNIKSNLLFLRLAARSIDDNQKPAISHIAHFAQASL